jgi:DNA-binding transcriptional MerR regulator
MDKAERTTEGSAPQGPVILTTGEVAEVLGIKGYQLVYLLETKRIPPPRKTLLGRRLFYTQADLEEIRERLRNRA